VAAVAGLIESTCSHAIKVGGVERPRFVLQDRRAERRNVSFFPNYKLPTCTLTSPRSSAFEMALLKAERAAWHREPRYA